MCCKNGNCKQYTKNKKTYNISYLCFSSDDFKYGCKKNRHKKGRKVFELIENI